METSDGRSERQRRWIWSPRCVRAGGKGSMQSKTPDPFELSQLRNCLPSYSDFARRANLPGVVDLLVS
jgi:hypothetical protein